MLVSAVIPAYNEEARIGKTIRGLRTIAEIGEILVVDDGSLDRTAAAARQAGADVVLSLPVNQGKGAALVYGARAARGEILCFVDADLEASSAEFAKLLTPVLQGQADMAVARFPAAARPAGIGLVKGLASWGIRRLSGYTSLSPLSGQRVLRRCVWDAAVCARDGFGVEVGLTVDCVRRGYSVCEVPVVMAHRETGRDWHGFRHRGKQFVDVFLTLCRLWANRRERLK